MSVLKSICVLTPFVLLIPVSILAEVYDDEGNIITEDEIKKEMCDFWEGYRGCCCLIGVPVISLGFGFMILGFGSEGFENHEMQLIGTAITAIGIGQFYLGHKIDRHKAIERIKEKRRSQKQGLLDSQGGVVSNC